MVFTHFSACDEVWHAGDIGSLAVLHELEHFKPTRAVYGNIDDASIRRATQEHLRWQCEGVDVWMTHIGGRPGHYANPVREAMKSNPPQLFICGHSHICLAMRDSQYNCLHLNPGAVGKHGFHHIRTIMRFTVDQGIIDQLEVIELGPRTERLS